MVDEKHILMDPSPESNGESEKRIRRLERLSWWMDDAFEIPFLKWRIGLDALFGLIPGFGDLAGAIVAGVVLWEAVSMKVSAWIIAQMGLNVVLESIVGTIPILGDLFDIHFRANRRNVELLKAGALSPQVQTKRSRFVLILVGSGFIAAILAMVGLTVWLLGVLWGGLTDLLARIDIGKIMFQLRDAFSNIF